MVGLGNSVKGAPTSAVELSCLHDSATIVMVCRSSKGSYVKDYLVISCMYIFCRFHPTLDGAILRAFINDARSFFSVYGGKYSKGSYSRACYKFMCFICALYVMIGLCMFSYFHPVLGGAILPMVVHGSP